MVYPILAAGPVKVFVLIGQSNMQGYGLIKSKEVKNDKALGTLDYIVKNDSNYGHLKTASGEWSSRDDVWYYHRAGGIDSYKEIKKDLTTGLGVNSGFIGPELQFGHVMGNYFDEQVLIIKAAWGGKSLGEDFLPPSASGPTGPYYSAAVNIVNDVLKDIGSHFKGYTDQGYEIAGIGWHQGWNDAGQDKFVEAYTENLVTLVKDIRVDLKKANLPFVIVSSGHGGFEEKPYGGGWMKTLQSEVGPKQMAVAKKAEFKGNVAAVDGRPFWRNDTLSPDQVVYHWNLNAESYLLIGNSMGEEMLKLLPPKEVLGCMDTLYQEFDSTATVNNQGACSKPILAIGRTYNTNEINLVQTNAGLKVIISEPIDYQISIYTYSGKIIQQWIGNSPKIIHINNSPNNLPNNLSKNIPNIGLYILKLRTPEHNIKRMVYFE